MAPVGARWSAGLGRRAIVLTGDRFDDAKTAHGLLRSSALFDLVAIVDTAHCGASTLDTIADGSDVPVVARVSEAPGSPEVAIVGIATYGGAIPPIVRRQVADALEAGLDIVSGLHEQIADDPELSTLVSRHAARVVELRAPLAFHEQRFWSGAALDVAVPSVALLGTDCDIGKRTTLVRLADELRRRGRVVEVVATGQTGLLQGARQGFVLDATPLDFISGALERAMLDAASHHPDLILVQGQGSFRGPTGQVGPQLLVHTGVRHAILQHAPGRRFYKSTPEVPIASPDGDLDLIRLYGAQPLAMTLNGSGLSQPERSRVQADLAAANGLPVLWPDPGGIVALADLVEVEVLASPRIGG